VKDLIIAIVFGFSLGLGSSLITIFTSNRHNEEMKRIDAVMAQINKCTDTSKVEDNIIKTSPKGIQKHMKKKNTEIKNDITSTL